MKRETFQWIIAWLVAGCILVGFFGCIGYSGYRVDIWRSPCTRVYDGDTIIYEGKSKFYRTETRGASTMFQEYQKRFIFPRMIKEIISAEITAETISCE